MIEPAAALRLGPGELRTLLARELIPVDIGQQRRAVDGRTVLVTGAGGSVGAELVRSVIAAGASRIVMLDDSEAALFRIDETVRQLAATANPDLAYRSVLGSVCDAPLVAALLAEECPDLVLHTAACKHVDMVERNPLAGIRTNVIGTSNILRAARAAAVPRLLLISTDKAVRPVSLMGATKRAAELLVRAYADRDHRYASVRFGNVLGSSGSVLEVFLQRAAAGLPLEVRHPEASRFFLAGSEAAGLLLTGASLAAGGDLLILQTGPPRRILDLAADLIGMLRPEIVAGAGSSLPIQITHLRPGERVAESLCDGEPRAETDHPSIVRLEEPARDPDEIRALTDALVAACNARQEALAVEILRRMVPEFHPEDAA